MDDSVSEWQQPRNPKQARQCHGWQWKDVDIWWLGAWEQQAQHWKRVVICKRLDSKNVPRMSLRWLLE